MNTQHSDMSNKPNSVDKKNTANNLQNTPLHFDVVISGGGLSGALMALSLSKIPVQHSNEKPLSIAIVESYEANAQQPLSFDDRVLALSHGSVNTLKKLGVWQTLSQDVNPKDCAIKHIHISDKGYYGKARLNAEDHQVEALGYVVEMSRLGKALLNALATVASVTWFMPDTIKNIAEYKEHNLLTLNSGTQLAAQLLIGCDGAQSICRELSGIKTHEVDYQQSALIANISPENSHKNIAFERFTEHGPIAVLPLSNSQNKPRCSLVWTMSSDDAEIIKNADENTIKQKLQQAFGTWLGEIKSIGKCAVYPLKLVQAQGLIHHRLALVGNSSHTLHPIAGQGFNLGLRDVVSLSSLIESALKVTYSDKNQQIDIGSLKLLMQYEHSRKADHQHIISFTDSLVTCFSNELPPLVVGRNIGLKVLNYLAPLKKMLAKKTMGY